MPGSVRLASRISRAGWIHQDQYAGVRMLGLKRRGWYTGVGTLGYAGICRAKESFHASVEYAPVAMPIVAPLLVRNPLFTEMLFTARHSQPSLSITGSRQLAIVLHWNLNLDNNHPDMLCYVICASRGLTAPPPPRPHDWERLSSVMATNLPMELKISNLINGETDYFAVAGVDVHLREGPLSRAASNINLHLIISEDSEKENAESLTQQDQPKDEGETNKGSQLVERYVGLQVGLNYFA
uniref:Activating transcription factor 7-interacting protein Fn3 domain-containing protein n=1 Tax=Strigamia maritima TaxID=126957 RepID=T1IJK1_STRMM